MNNTADDSLSTKNSNTPRKKGLFEASSNNNSNKEFNDDNLNKVNDLSTLFHADDSTNVNSTTVVHRMNESIEKKEEEESNINNECNDEYLKDVKHSILLHADDSSNIVHRMKQNIERKEKEKRKFSKEILYIFLCIMAIAKKSNF